MGTAIKSHGITRDVSPPQSAGIFIDNKNQQNKNYYLRSFFVLGHDCTPFAVSEFISRGNESSAALETPKHLKHRQKKSRYYAGFLYRFLLIR